MAKYRQEKDSMGSIQVPEDVLYGAQTQRSLEHFSIGIDKMPPTLISSFGLLKKAAALVNYDLKKLPLKKKNLIVRAADEVIRGKLLGHFPLHIWQTGSGTQTNMNVNEVIANRAIEMVKGVKGSKDPIHPNDDVNMSQSSNDTFPSAMHIAAVIKVHKKLIPSLERLTRALHQKERAFRKIIKVGRTHLQDATNLTLGEEFSGYVSLLKRNLVRIDMALDGLYDLAIGGTAVGTGLNSHPEFGERMAKKLEKLTSLPFRSHPNKFAALSSHDEVVFMSGSLKTLAGSLLKIANDIRWLGSGPRCGLHELILPENEPGSSIMPGKVNPTQCEALSMVAVQVMGNDAAISFAGSQGNFELNVYKPIMIFNLLHAIDLLSDAMNAFEKYCIRGLKANQKKIAFYVKHSLMMVTKLSPIIGYDACAKLAHFAYQKDLSLKEACLRLKLLSAKEFDRILKQ